MGAAPCEEEQSILRSTAQDAKGQILERASPNHQTLELWPSLHHRRHNIQLFRSMLIPQLSRPDLFKPITQIAAWDTGFIMMNDDRDVYTMGDERFAPCLGRGIPTHR